MKRRWSVFVTLIGDDKERVYLADTVDTREEARSSVKRLKESEEIKDAWLKREQKAPGE